jgi:hypothetical protein
MEKERKSIDREELGRTHLGRDEACGKGGDYLLIGVSSTEQATAENPRVLMESAKEYGVI